MKKICILLTGIVILSVCGCSMGTNGYKQEEKSEGGGQNFSLIESNKVAEGGGYELTDDFERNLPVINTVENTWESIDVLNPSVIMWKGKYYNYYSGWDGNVWRTGIAVSEDGINWTKKSDNPILDVRNDSWDSAYIVANGSAVVFQNKVYYFYQGTEADTKTSAIGLAISNDAENFEERTNSPVLQSGEDIAWDCRGVADPYVINFNGKLYMYYLGQNEKGIQRLGVAVSEDGVNWVKYANNPIMDVGVKGAFDENGLGEPSVVYRAPYFYMLYTGRNAEEQRNIGVAVSLDGVTWKKMNYQGIVDLSENTWNNQVICDTTLLEDTEGKCIVWYGGGNVPSPAQNLNGKIGRFEISLDGVADETCFNVNSDWKSMSVDSKDFLVGSYGIEGDGEDKSAWCSDNVSIVLRNEHDAEKVYIRGYLPLDLHQNIGKESVQLSFYINELLVEEKEFHESEVFELELTKPDSMKNTNNIFLRIEASSSVIPKEHQMSEDERELSWIVKEIDQN